MIPLTLCNSRSPKSANQTNVASNGQVTGTPSPLSGWVFFGILEGFMIISTATLRPFRRQTRGLVSAVSVILKTPFTFLRVVPSSWGIIEVPSFYRGLVGLWVIAGLILISAYQSDVFVTDGVTLQSFVQPGSLFTSGLPTSSVTTNVSLSIVLFQTPITCDPTQFTLWVVADGTTSSGSLSDPPIASRIPLFRLSTSRLPSLPHSASRPRCLCRSLQTPLLVLLCSAMVCGTRSCLKTTTEPSPRSRKLSPTTRPIRSLAMCLFPSLLCRQNSLM